MPFHFFILFAFPELAIAKYWKELYLAGILLIFLARQIARKRLSIRLIIASPFVGIFVGSIFVRAGLGIVLGEDRFLVIYGTYNILYFIVLAGLTRTLIRSRREAERFLFSLMVLMAIVGCLAVLDWQWEWARNLDRLSDRVLLVTIYVGSKYRAYLGCDSPMELGIYLSVGFILALYFLARPRPTMLGSAKARSAGLTRFWAGLSALGSMSGLLVTFSRGPLVAATGASIFIVIFVRNGLSIRTAARTLLAAVALAALASPLVVSGYGEISRDWSTFLASTFDWSSDPGNVVRVIRWFEGISRFLESPLIGHGIGTSSTRLQTYRQESLGDKYFQTESAVISFAVDGGLLVLLPFVVMSAGLFGSLLRTAAAPVSRDVRALAVVLLGVLAALYLELTINPALDFRSFAVVLWTLVGLAFRVGDPTTRVNISSASLAKRAKAPELPQAPRCS